MMATVCRQIKQTGKAPTRLGNVRQCKSVHSGRYCRFSASTFLFFFFQNSKFVQEKLIITKNIEHEQNVNAHGAVNGLNF